MQQFLIIACAHFLALLSPGPDFFLVARTSIAAGWRLASGVCLGIALANALFIATAFAGLAILREGSALFIALQLAGAGYLLYIGSLFVRHAGRSGLASVAANTRVHSWWRSLGTGFLSALLNPKNALFYASLAGMLASASVGWKWAYSFWMFGVVLVWDLLVALAIGNPLLLRRFVRALPWLERACGLMLMALAVALVCHLARG
ncbi:LysE family translocator [Pseudomonas sp.]|uniref:LysE family translocator n=1 Tax=Pseudomonas sp. TaxID=306 RepID=UPI0028AB917D|nr:LysE family translocator [Pseudomonas sp.]